MGGKVLIFKLKAGTSHCRRCANYNCSHCPKSLQETAYIVLINNRTSAGNKNMRLNNEFMGSTHNPLSPKSSKDPQQSSACRAYSPHLALDRVWLQTGLVSTFALTLVMPLRPQTVGQDSARAGLGTEWGKEEQPWLASNEFQDEAKPPGVHRPGLSQVAM